MLDTTKYFVVALDALGNGVSSSPSNSTLQPRMRFPRFTIRDIVKAHHEGVTGALRLDHVKAVIGTSMGGMQTFEWMVTFPGFMDLAIPIAGSPRLAAYDLLVWRAQLDAIMHDAAWKDGDYAENPARVIGAAFSALLLTTPQHYNEQTTRAQAAEELEKAARTPAFDANDKIRQMQAMLAMDVSRDLQGSLDRAAAAVQAKTFVIVAKADHVVTPGPALEFARLLGAKTLVLEGDCGHLASSCEAAVVNQAVGEFLSR